MALLVCSNYQRFLANMQVNNAKYKECAFIINHSKRVGSYQVLDISQYQRRRIGGIQNEMGKF